MDKIKCVFEKKEVKCLIFWALGIVALCALICTVKMALRKKRLKKTASRACSL